MLLSSMFSFVRLTSCSICDDRQGSHVYGMDFVFPIELVLQGLFYFFQYLDMQEQLGDQPVLQKDMRAKNKTTRISDYQKKGYIPLVALETTKQRSAALATKLRR